MINFDSTCGISQLPIKKGDKILLFPIIKRMYAKDGGSSFSRSDNQYAPISLPLYGLYNGKGGLEEVYQNGEFALNIFESYLEKGSLLKIDEKELSKIKEKNPTFDVNIKDIESLTNLYIQKPLFEGLGCMLVLEDIYKELMGNYSNVKSKNLNIKERVRVENSVYDFIEGIKKMEKKRPQIEEEIQTTQWRINLFEEGDGKEELYRYLIKLVDELNVFNGNYKKAFPNNHFVDHFFNQEANVPFNKVLLLELVKIYRKEDDIIDSYIDLMMFENLMDDIRKTWYPQSVGGFSSESLSLQRVLARKILNDKIKQ